MNAKAEKVKSKKTIKKIIVAVLVSVLALYCAVMLIKNTSDISRLKAQAAECDTQYAQQIEDNEDLKSILNSDDKDEYIEQKAREKGYVKDGEVVFYDISESK